VHPRYVNPGVFVGDRTPEHIRKALLDNAKQDGEAKDAEAEHVGASAPIEARFNLDGPIHRLP
jgi:hypothetical protein